MRSESVVVHIVLEGTPFSLFLSFSFHIEKHLSPLSVALTLPTVALGGSTATCNKRYFVF